jgi:hypothetical protein
MFRILLALRTGVIVLTCVCVSLAQEPPDADRPRGDLAPPVVRTAPQPIAPPADPQQIRGTYELGGETRQLTEGEFYDTYLYLKPLESPQAPLLPPKVLEHILLFAEAEYLGFGLNSEEAALINPLKTRPEFESMLRDRLKGWNVTEEQYVRLQAENSAIQRMKDWYASSLRVRSEEAFDLWKRDNFRYIINYVEFSGEDAVQALGTPDEADLREFWARYPQIQNKYMTPTSVTADVVVFDPASVSSEEIARIKGSRMISREDALQYFVTNRDRLVKQIPSEERPKLYPPPHQKVPIEDLVTPFALLRDQIEREIIIGDRIAQAYEAAAGVDSAAGIEDVARKFGLSYRRLAAASRENVLSQHGDLSGNLFVEMFNATPNSLSAGIQFNGPLQYFWRLESKSVSSLPPFEEVKDRLSADWREIKSYEKAQSRIKEILDAMDEAVQAETGEREAEIDKKSVLEAEEEIKRQGITDTRRMDAERQKFRSIAENEKRLLRAEVAPKYFDKVVAESGLEVKTLGPFAFTFGHRDRSEIEDPEENKQAFLQSSFQIRSLNPGQVSPILSDVVTHTNFLAKVVSKEEPRFEEMPPEQYYQRKMGVERQGMYAMNAMWTSFQVQQRLGWKAQ